MIRVTLKKWSKDAHTKGKFINFKLFDQKITFGKININNLLIIPE